MLRPAHILQLAVVGLLGLAVVMVHSAGMTIDGGSTAFRGDFRGGLRGMFTSRHTIYALIAVAAFFMGSRINVRRVVEVRTVFNPAWWLLLTGIALTMLAMVPGVGVSINGAHRWLRAGPVTFQPSELVKWFMVAAVALWCTRRQGAVGRFGAGLLPMLIVVAVACGVIIIEDLGTAVLVGLVACALLVAGGARLWHLALLLPAGGAVLTAAILRNPYRVTRLTSFMDPWADPRGSGYHAIQSLLAIAQGGLFGRGLGNGIQKFGYVPADTTDFIFAVICEELGLPGAVLVVAAYLAILIAGLVIVRQSRDNFSRLLALGVIMTVGLQAIINLAVVTVLIPTKGIALPLLSAGGTGWIVTAFMLGLVAALDNAHALERQADNPAEHYVLAISRSYSS